MIKEKIINDNLNLFLLHNNKDSNRELILAKNNNNLHRILEDLKSQTNRNVNLDKSWISIKDILMLLDGLPKSKQKLYSEKILHILSRFRTITSKKEVCLPLKISDELVYILGVIIGDGSLVNCKTKKTYPVYVCGTNREYIKGDIKIARQ